MFSSIALLRSDNGVDGCCSGDDDDDVVVVVVVVVMLGCV